MKATFWISHAACVVVGAVVGFALQPDNRPSGSEPAVLLEQPESARQAGAAPGSTPTAGFQPSLAGPPLRAWRSRARPAASSGPDSRNPDWEAPYQRGASEYAASFQAGVFSGEPLPQYIAAYFASNLKGYPLVEGHARHLQEPADGWSNEMEVRLRSYLESQPEIARVHISISCRTSGCELQIITPADESTGPPAWYVMFSRLTRESWFTSQFAVGGGLNGARGAAVGYRLENLPRRK
jgi:hypothetical protein